MSGTIRNGRPFYAAPRPVTVSAAVAAVGALLLLGGTFLLSDAGTSPADASAPGATFAERFTGEMPSFDCANSAWPYFKPQCLRMADGSRARQVRVISIDRIAPGERVMALAK